MLGLIVVYVLAGLALAVLLWAGTLWFQGYIYSEPAGHLYWRAPAAGIALTLFLAVWGWVAYRAPGRACGQGFALLATPLRTRSDQRHLIAPDRVSRPSPSRGRHSDRTGALDAG